ncbi:Cystathionine beta-lyase MetC [Fundidesulfovibrio magnetotacticus]|uniref:Cystathionine beta-lyase MetC n=1 Tax=Fundidesulfovibrio magnetotacticus TaxID=2730080 RepID=A0A6V8LT44_9BACT|nr:PLP-dependent transferase [Fundidesulfovibrio magnetotacticus]GFK94130.1 Cystathionine beta-lyase MetC [Fundidesulfovibrio magnetotacticus]
MDRQTHLVHAGLEGKGHHRAASVLVYHATTFAQDGPEHIRAYVSSRFSNPTREALEKAAAGLEGGARGLAFASGLAAISAALLLFKPGDHIVASRDVYGGAYKLLADHFARRGLHRHSPTDPETAMR